MFYVVTAPEQMLQPSASAGPSLGPTASAVNAPETPQQPTGAAISTSPVPSATPTFQAPSGPLQSLQPLPSTVDLSIAPVPSPSLCVDLLGNVIVCVELP